MLSRSTASQLLSTEDDDDFQIPPTQTLSASIKTKSQKTPLKPSNSAFPPPKKPKRPPKPGKENAVFFTTPIIGSHDISDLDETCSLDLIPSSINCSFHLTSAQNRESDSERNGVDNSPVQCPLCGAEISDLNEEQRLVHTNDCLDNVENGAEPIGVPLSADKEVQCLPEVVDGPPLSPRQAVDVSPVVKWLNNLGLAKYADAFVREEVDWDTLKWLTEEDLVSIGVTALGPRKKIVHALCELRKGSSYEAETHVGHPSHENGSAKSNRAKKQTGVSNVADDELTQLVNMKLGIPWEKLQVLPLNQKINIAGIDITCLDANHCPGSIMILFEPPNGKAVLHTGDFRFSEEMAGMSLWHACPIHTLILDTTYCNPQYDFPKQEAVIQFVIEAIQAETFNPKTLFLIGSYTIGKERLFLEVARVLRRKVYITASKLRLLECLGFSQEDMQWFTFNEQESQIHVVPMWTLASFKRLKHIANQYAGRFSLIVAFSPTGWTFGKGKKKSPGRRWQQGTIIRYEVPYSEHCSFTELREFVKLLSPETIIPSVNNDGPDSAKAMVSLLLD
ncbi:hypothetical protein COLO4_21164 [Corchorus olitorius]|uniref:SAM domain-containing protein n=1 Tax=Corchorus olitorius TaxID=93759 RepID=A0A1R3IV35_9ROSI|nr:hypothetical protein COLO4_21164 [Corchorus olitorius]